MRLLRFLPLVSLTACTQSTGTYPAPDRATAGRAASALSAQLDGASKSLSAKANVAPVVGGTVSVTEACSLAGSVSIDGSYDVSDTSETYDMTASFDHCREHDGIFDGALHWNELVQGSTVRDSLHGTLDFGDASGMYSCLFDYALVVDATGAHYSGTVCGYTTAELDITY